jgi:hypothetical protein
MSLEGADDPLVQVMRFIAGKPMLLVLDNFEHLLEGSLLLSELLRSCPRLQLLVTSRECLKLTEEWLLPLEGMSFPEGAVSVDGATATFLPSQPLREASHYTVALAPDVMDSAGVRLGAEQSWRFQFAAVTGISHRYPTHASRPGRWW